MIIPYQRDGDISYISSEGIPEGYLILDFNGYYFSPSTLNEFHKPSFISNNNYWKKYFALKKAGLFEALRFQNLGCFEELIDTLKLAVVGGNV
jgi:hypothetical protein